MAHCFVCDEPVDGDQCPTCGTAAWIAGDSGHEPAPPQPTHDERSSSNLIEQGEIRPHDERSSSNLIEQGEIRRQPISFGISEAVTPDQVGGVRHLDAVPELADRSPVDRATTLPRWPLAAALILVVALVAIRIPSGREDVRDASLGELTAPATPLPEPQSYDLVFVPSNNTTVAVIGEGASSLLAMRRYGPLDPIYASSVATRNGPEAAAVDVTPGGLVITWDGDEVTLWSPALGVQDQLANGVSGPPVLSPNGRMLAVPVETAVFVYDLVGATPGQSIADVHTSAVSDVTLEVVHWSPDGRFIGGGDRTQWIVFDSESGVTQSRGEGELLAVSGARSVAVRIDDGVEWRVSENTIQRSWPELLRADGDLHSRAEFSPDGLHLAVQSARPDAAGVYVLELAGSRIFRAGIRPGIGTNRALTWSGDGRALYWLDGTQLVAWLPSTRQTVLIAEREDVSEFPDRIHGIRAYDQALVPTGMLTEQPAAPPTVMADGAVMRLSQGSVVVDQEGFEAPPSVELTGGVAAGGDDRRWGAEFAGGRIAFETGPAWTFTSNDHVWLDGTSLTSLGDQFMWLAGGDLYSEASYPDPLMTGTRLGNGEIVAAVGVRDSLVVAFRDVGRVTQLWQIPAWSEALSQPLVINRGGVLPSSPFTIAGTWLDADSASMSRNIAQDAFTVTLTTRNGAPQTTVFFYPETDVSSVCGVQLGACQGPIVTGTPETFSPDGHWLLVDAPGDNLALSTRGRGIVPLIGETALWQP